MWGDGLLNDQDQPDGRTDPVGEESAAHRRTDAFGPRPRDHQAQGIRAVPAHHHPRLWLVPAIIVVNVAVYVANGRKGWARSRRPSQASSLGGELRSENARRAVLAPARCSASPTSQRSDQERKQDESALREPRTHLPPAISRPFILGPRLRSCTLAAAEPRAADPSQI